jgi:DNA-binding MarR family transcriptional regulator
MLSGDSALLFPMPETLRCLSGSGNKSVASLKQKGSSRRIYCCNGCEINATLRCNGYALKQRGTEIGMPGGRLTQQERQQIALGLADGLAYAEIARRIDRPTSTITREVMRNGGPTGYRADLAHHATERRAHRRRPAVPREAEQLAEAVRDYEETFTANLMQSGLPRMMARVLTCLYTTNETSLTAADLARHVEVSPASVSKAITFLESQGLIRRERDERRRERYLVDDNALYLSMIATARSNAQFAATARQGVGVLGQDTPAGVRLENIARFVDFVAESIMRAAEQARDLLHTKPERE